LLVVFEIWIRSIPITLNVKLRTLYIKLTY
jgi:hypothetical protein